MSREIAIRASGLGKRYELSRPRRQRAHAALGGLAGRLFGGGTRGSTEAFWAVRDCSFTLHAGETVGVIGHNGAGKSVLLKMLARITKPTAGFAEISGRLVSLLEVGSGFHPELSGRENIFLNAAIHGVRRSDIQSKIDSIIEFSGISRFLDEPVKHYSSGMYMRLAYSVAAHLDADILLFDEVLAVGDSAFQSQCLAHLEKLRARGTAILLVSHAMGSVASLCSRALVLDSGQLVFDGDVAEAVRRYEARKEA